MNNGRIEMFELLKKVLVKKKVVRCKLKYESILGKYFIGKNFGSFIVFIDLVMVKSIVYCVLLFFDGKVDDVV